MLYTGENMLKERQQAILTAVIQEYIDTARPVASRDLVRRFRLEVSPATVRSDMLSLDELGYLEQPHTSAGRIPTDKGLRFFVDHLASEILLSPEEQTQIRHRFHLRDEDEFIRAFGRTIAEISGMFTMAGLSDDGYFYETGFSGVLEEPEFQDPYTTRMFGRVVDALGQDLNEWRGDIEEEKERIYIGNENPRKDARECAMFFSHWQHPRGFNGFLAMIGPRRTNYRKHKAILNFLNKLSYER